MIPKIIHYCWFGRNPLPELARKCIASWRKYLPDYEIKEWNEDNFDVNIIPYTAEAYAQKKYAFVSDYARFWILYRYGGIYFDTDVEVIRPLDDIIARGCFMGFETDPAPKQSGVDACVNPGLGLGVAPGLGLIKKCWTIMMANTLYTRPICATKSPWYTLLRRCCWTADWPISRAFSRWMACGFTPPSISALSM